MSPIITPLSPPGVAPVTLARQGPLDAPARQGPLDASARKFAALMDPVPETAAVDPDRPSSLAQALLQQDEGPGSIDRTLACTGEGSTEGEGTRPSPMPVQPAALDMPFMFHLRA
jgi:hypothetical protein